MEIRAKVTSLGNGTKKAEATPKKALPAKGKSDSGKKAKRKGRKKEATKAQSAARQNAAEETRSRKRKKSTKAKAKGKESTALVIWDPSGEITKRDEWWKRALKHVGGAKGITIVAGTAIVVGASWKMLGGVVPAQALRAVLPVVLGSAALTARNKTVARIGGTAAALGLFALSLDTYHRLTSATGSLDESETQVADAPPQKNGRGNGNGGGSADTGSKKPEPSGDKQA